MTQTPDITIGYAKAEDARIICDFNVAMALETEGKALDRDVVFSGVQRLIANPSYGFYVVARDGDQVAASLMVTTEWSDWRDGIFWWIQSVYVSPDYRRRGIYRKMYDFVRGAASKNPDICGFRLYVDGDNKGAQKTYADLGMSETDYRLYEELVGRG